MNTQEIGKIANKINLDLIRMGLNDAEISFVGMNLYSYSIASTVFDIIENEGAIKAYREAKLESDKN